MQNSIEQEDFNKFQSLIMKKIGIKFPEIKRSLLVSRLINHVKDLGLNSFGEYYDYLVNNEDKEFEFFIDKITTHTTYFFRESEHFDFLINNGIDIVNNNFNKPVFKVLSAGASTGEELYTLAMILAEQKAHTKIVDYKIDGADISKKALLYAKRGIFKIASLESIPKQYKIYFKLSGDKIEAKENIKRNLRFFALNISNIDQKFPDMYHIIFCRNLLIYFSPSIQQVIIDNLSRVLIPGGLLFTGHSESLQGLTHNLKRLAPTIYLRG